MYLVLVLIKVTKVLKIGCDPGQNDTYLTLDSLEQQLCLGCLARLGQEVSICEVACWNRCSGYPIYHRCISKLEEELIPPPLLLPVGKKSVPAIQRS